MQKFILAVFFALVPAIASPTSDVPTAFAQCLADRGAVMYSAWYCPYCFQQLRLIDPDTFTDQADMRDEEKMHRAPFVVNCVSDDGKKMLPVCTPEGIRGVPTWKYQGENIGALGMKTLDELSRVTGCKNPE